MFELTDALIGSCFPFVAYEDGFSSIPRGMFANDHALQRHERKVYAQQFD